MTPSTGVILFLFVLAVLMLSIYCVFTVTVFQPSTKYINYTPPYPYEDIDIGGVRAWWFHSYPYSKTILYNHGNFHNISFRQYIIDLCHRLRINLFLYDYPGFGKSVGIPSQWGILDSGLKVYDWLTTQAQVPASSVIVWGESLGGAPATYIASKRRCASLVLFSTFSSLEDIVVDTYPTGVAKVVTGAMKVLIDMMPSKNYIGSVTCPVLIVHSGEDNLIPYSNAVRMYNMVPGEKKIITISGGHASPKLSLEDLRDMLEFLGINTETYHETEDVLADMTSLGRKFKLVREHD